jgi:integrating conjugative element protein (TIGR03757 family)
MGCPDSTVSKHRYRTARRGWLAVWMLILSSGSTAADVIHPLIHMEVFTTTGLDGGYKNFIDPELHDSEIDLQVYRLDGIQSMERTLSDDLPPDAVAAKQIVLQRLQHMGQRSTAQMRQAAVGLAKVMQYGIDRVPAIVFDGTVVIYGVTDPDEALQRYRRWRAGL